MGEKMINFRVIGDVHGEYSRYLPLAKEAEYSLQVGDLGFDYSPIKELDPVKHRVIAGNHDNYSKYDTSKFLAQTEHFLGDYGVHTIPGFGEFFFVRGGRSIDWEYRIKGRSWWEEEELTYAEGLKALELYKKTKPQIVFSHECPTDVIEFVSGFKTWDGEPIMPSRTAHLLNSMLSEHQPKTWIFGHHHKDWQGVVKGTEFRCLGILSFVDFDENGNLIKV